MGIVWVLSLPSILLLEIFSGLEPYFCCLVQWKKRGKGPLTLDFKQNALEKLVLES